jgi:hypothetical protein
MPGWSSRRQSRQTSLKEALRLAYLRWQRLGAEEEAD